MLTRSVSFLQQVVSGVKLFRILFSVLENIWQRRRWNLLFICYSLFQLVRVGLNVFDKLNFPFEWNYQSRLWVSHFDMRLTKIWGWLHLSDSSNQEGAYRHLPKLLRKIHAVRESPCNANEWKRNTMLLENFCFYVPVVQNFPATSGVTSKFPERFKLGF